MTRETSMAAYETARASGLVGLRQLQVLRIVALHGPMTANEAFNVLSAELGKEFRFDSNTRARFTELRDLNLLQEDGRRQCTITGRACISWKLTGMAPAKTPPRVTPRQRIKQLEEQIRTLQREIQSRVFQPALF